MSKMNIFSWFPTDNIDSLIDNQDKTDVFMEEFRMSINRIRYEKETTLYYEQNNRNEFIDWFNLNSEYNGYGIMNMETVVYKLLDEKENPDIECLNTSEDNNIYKLWDIDSKVLYDDFPTILKSLVNKKLDHPLENFVFFNFHKAFNSIEIIPIFKDCRNDTSLPKFVHIKQVNGFLDLDNWLIDNRKTKPKIKTKTKSKKTRNYNLDDPRHVESHPRYIRGKSPIIGGENGKLILKNLLPTALCDNQKKDLIAYDEENERYVWYEYEGDNLQYQYHGYHLAIPKTHKRDLKAEKNIPDGVIDIIKYRKKLAKNS